MGRVELDCTNGFDKPVKSFVSKEWKNLSAKKHRLDGSDTIAAVSRPIVIEISSDDDDEVIDENGILINQMKLGKHNDASCNSTNLYKRREQETKGRTGNIDKRGP